MVTEVNYFFNIQSFCRLVVDFLQIGNCHILPIYIVPLMFQCSPKICYLVECFHLSVTVSRPGTIIRGQFSSRAIVLERLRPQDLKYLKHMNMYLKSNWFLELFRTNMSSFTPERTVNESQNTIRESYQCTICDRRFCTNRGLNHHRRSFQSKNTN